MAINIIRLLLTALVCAIFLTGCNDADAVDLKMFEDFDPELGMIRSKLPLPASWQKVENDPEFALRGPNNIRISNSQTAQFRYTNDPQMAQLLAMQGVNLRPPMNLEQVIDEYLMPVAREQNSRLVKTYPLPAVAQSVQSVLVQMYSSMPMERRVDAYGTDWEGDDGNRATVVVQIMTFASGSSLFWSLQTQYLIAPESHHEDAKAAWLYGLANYVHNPRWMAAYNQKEAQRSKVAYQQHQNRMAAIRAAGNQATATANNYSDILDSSHASYLKRDAMRDAGQSRTVNAIQDQTVVYNPSSGQRYQVQSTSNHHWVNRDETTYVGTDNPLFDPRTDPNFNQGDWSKLEEER